MWLGMPVHCQLEAVSAASVLACATESDCTSAADDDCEGDFCNSLESGDYIPQKNVTIVKAPLTPLLFDLSITDQFVLRPDNLSVSRQRTVPLLATSWHFVQRVASPPRAPSALV